MTATETSETPAVAVCPTCSQPPWAHLSPDGVCVLPLVKLSMDGELRDDEARARLQEWIGAARPQDYDLLMQAAIGPVGQKLPTVPARTDAQTDSIMAKWRDAASNAEIEPYRPSVLPGDHAWARMQEIATAVSGAVTLPPALRGKPADVLLLLLAGHDVGIAPTVALNKIHVIEGKPSMSAELMRALVLDSGHLIRPEISNAEQVVMVGRRSNWAPEEAVRCDWPIERARTAGLVGKDVWKKYPEAMLAARATSELCRLIFPDVLAGVSYTPEELGSDVDGDGAPLRVASTIVPPADPWAEAGWDTYEEERDAHIDINVRAKALPDEARAKLRAFRDGTGWPIRPRPKFEAFVKMVDDAEAEIAAAADAAAETSADDDIAEAEIVPPADPSVCTSCGQPNATHTPGCPEEPF